MKIKQIDPAAFKKLSLEFQTYIDDNKTGCVLCAIYHRDKLVYCNKFGWKDKENQIPIAFDDIFRIYSMTKPITCLAALILHEQGKFDLDDPLEKYLPEFKNPKVLKSYDDKTGKTVLEEIKNPITIKQLFTHTSGLSYGDDPEEIPVDKLYGEKFGFTDENRLKTKLDMFPIMPPLDEFSKRLATLPLAFAPGAHWWYAFSHEILGFLIEVLSGKKLDVFLKKQIFDKLGMNDTDFYVPKEKWTRLTKVFTKNQDDKLIEVEGVIYEGFKHKIQFLSGGGGLVSTVEDYMKFCLMMLNGGQYKNNQIVSKETIELMTSNQLPNDNTFLDMQYIKYEDSESIKRNEGYGFGLGVQVKIAENMSRSGIGDYGWGGAFNTFFDIDPMNQVISIVLTQYCPEDSDWIFPIDWLRINNLVYEALEKTGSKIRE
ncbi:MAG: beta-lactamase family protein [Candidatus Lokiarchaeota archaeon]|nr:beta-lactamase family protein [Candidatus Lokiarchaeota archaeon]